MSGSKYERDDDGCLRGDDDGWMPMRQMSRWAGNKKKVSHIKLSERWMVESERVGWRRLKEIWVRRLATEKQRKKRVQSCR